jgi:hypothetical protein
LRAANCAARPFRSVPAEAAVAEALGTLLVSLAVHQHPLEGHAEFVGHDLRHLGVQALAHLGAAVVHLHAAVGVHMHQRTGLVEQRGGEADAELDRRERHAALDDGALRVPAAIWPRAARGSALVAPAVA